MNDSISRQQAIQEMWKALHEYEDKTEKKFIESDDLDVSDWIQHRVFVQNMSDIDRQTILNLPSAYPVNYGSTKSDSSSQLKLNNDLISRQAAIDIVRNRVKRFTTACVLAVTEIEKLPSAQPQRKTGKWINNSPVTMKCDQCGYVIKDWRWNELNFCANCGANMRGEQDG